MAVKKPVVTELNDFNGTPISIGDKDVIEVADKKKKKEKKTKVYECFHYEAEFDDLGKYYWCHNSTIPCSECKVGKGYYCQQFCPGYKKGNYKGEWVISDWEKKEAEEYKAKIVQESKEKEIAERAMLKYLKEKYES